MTANLLRRQPPFNAREYSVLAIGLNRTRERLPFALCGYCFMPDHIYAIIFPRGDDDHLDVIRSFKLTTLQLLKRSGDRDTGFWQSRFYDHVLRTRKEYDDAEPGRPDARTWVSGHLTR